MYLGVGAAVCMSVYTLMFIAVRVDVYVYILCLCEYC